MSVRPSVRQSVCPISRTQQRRAAGLLLSTGKRYRSTAPGARQQQRRSRGRSAALSSKCGQCHVDSRVDEAEHRLGLISILLQFQQYSLLVCNLCPDGNMHGIIIPCILPPGLDLDGLDLDGSMDKNIPYFVVENLATLAADADVTARHIRISSSATATRWH